jgi:gluconolactonase
MRIKSNRNPRVPYVLLRGLAVFGASLLLSWSCFGGDSATDPGSMDELSADLAKSTDILQHAGASHEALTKFESQWRRQWPEEDRELTESLQKASTSEISEYVTELSTPSPDDQYGLGSDFVPRPEVPRGRTFEFTLTDSRIFPGTTRRIRVYVPAEYTAERPACVYVQLDDLFFPAVAVFDNLIHKREVPVLIAIGVSPGVADSASPETNPRLNRSFEFDGLNDSLARFLLEEVFPKVELHKTPGGLPIRLSGDANDRAAGGVSTGGIAAFTLAWQRPDAFRRVFTGIGTFVGMRGGDRYPVLVRKTEPKPIRIFMQDGSNDELTNWLGEVGDWWMGNQTMQRALQFSGYEVEHVWGEGSHDNRHAISVFPEAMRWLWKDWPQPVTAGESQNNVLKAVLRPGEGWQVVSGPYKSASALASDLEGTVLFRDASGRRTWQVSADGGVSPSPLVPRPYTDMAFGPDGRAYVTETADGKIVSYTPDGKASTIASGMRGSSLVVTHRGAIYATEPGSDEHAGKLWLIETNGRKRQLDEGLQHPTAVTLSPDELWLAVAEGNSHWGYSYRILADGTVQDRQQFYWFHVPDEADDSGVRAWVTDREGYLYAATRMGVQVFDRNGRVRAILPVPGGEATGVALGGVGFDTLYVSCADHKLYRRRLKVQGAPAWSPPIKLPEWGAG